MPPTTTAADTPTVCTAEGPSPVSPPSVSTAEAGLTVVTREPADEPATYESILEQPIELEPDRVVRPRVPTERGLEYQREIRQRNLRSAIAKWKRKAGDLSDLLADCEDINVLANQRRDLLSLLDEVESAAESLSQVSIVEEQIETIQNRTEQLRMEINSKIRELKDEIRSTSSQRSKFSSRASSGRSSSRSAKAMKLEAAAKAVEMEVQLKYHSAEQEHKRVQIQKELEIAKARLQVIKETEEDETHPMKLPKAEEDAKQRVESYIQALPMETTLQQDIEVPATAVPVSTAMNIVLVGPSGVVPVTGTPTPVVPPTSTAITLPVVTSSVLTSSTSWLTTLPSATVPVMSVMAPVSFPTSDVTFPSVPTPIFSTRLSAVVSDVSISGLGLNPNAPQFVPSSSVTRPPGFVGLPTGFVQQHLL